jgi:hypothetical protein
MESPRLASSCKCYNQSELAAVITPFSCAADFLVVGTWLSLVEHSLGVRGVGSSNLPVPTISFLKSFVVRDPSLRSGFRLRTRARPASRTPAKRLKFKSARPDQIKSAYDFKRLQSNVKDFRNSPAIYSSSNLAIHSRQLN